MEVATVVVTDATTDTAIADEMTVLMAATAAAAVAFSREGGAAGGS